MSEERWTAVDAYVEERLLGSDSAPDDALRASHAAGLPTIAVSPSQGKFLYIIAKALGARRILELGTLGGYSGTWLGRALPADGQLITIEADQHHADVARANFAAAGLSNVVTIRVGRALDVLPQLQAEGALPFDLVFIDADKGNYAEYLDWAVRLSRPGTLIIADNVVRKGAVIDEASEDASVIGVRRFMDRANALTELAGTVLQTVGAKGYDGLAMLLVESPRS